jgi:hypothetical protein
VAGISTQHQPAFPLQAKPSCGMAVKNFIVRNLPLSVEVLGNDDSLVSNPMRQETLDLVDDD